MISMSYIGLIRPAHKLRIAADVTALTLILILMGCSGGGGGGGSATTLVSSTSGSVCMNGEYSYRVEVSGGTAQDIQLEPDPLAAGYQGSMGGQIKGVASMNLAASASEPVEMLVWGSGATIKYGTEDTVLGTVVLQRPGAVTDLAPIAYGGKQMIVYGTERGIGLAGADSSGKLTDLASSGAWRSVPFGVVSLAVSDDGSSILFASGDGYMQQISTAQLESGEKCSGVVVAGITPSSAGEMFVPVKAVIGGPHVLVLAKSSSTITTSAPTFEQAFDPIFSAIANDAPSATVAAISSSGGQAAAVGFTAEDGSFSRFDRFIPTDVASDGTNFYVVGIAYSQQAATQFIGSNCSGQQSSDTTVCLREAARNGTLVKYMGTSGLYQFTAGFFIYRKTDDFSKADHFAQIQLPAFIQDENAPSFIYVIEASGDEVYVRGPNFLTSMHRDTSSSGKEDWKYDAVADSKAGLMAGLPNRITPYAGGAVSSFTAVRADDGSGASALEIMAADRTFKVIDTGAIYVRVEGASLVSGKALVAAIEMAFGRGGKLYLENAAERNSISMGVGGAFASRAAYDGAKLAYAWSSIASEATQPWRLAVQAGTDKTTYGEKTINRQGESTGEFKDFPAVAAGEANPGVLRGIGGLMLSPKGTLTVLYNGYSASEGKWYDQLAIYPITKQASKYEIGAAICVMNTLVTQGGENEDAGSLLAVTESGGNYEAIFAAPAGIYSWKCVPPNNAEPVASQIFGTTNLVDAAVDAKGGSKISMVDGDKIVVKDLANRQASGLAVSVQRKQGSQLSKLVGAHVAMTGNAIALASPYGAAATFSLYSIAQGQPSLVAATPLSRFFDVKSFSAFPQYLLASSQASGIEIYSLAN